MKLRQDIESRGDVEDIESQGDVEEMHCCIASLTYSWQVNYT